MKTTQPSEGLVNGARGVVVRFHRETRWPVVKFANGGEYPITYETFPLIMCGRVLAQRSQLPLDLAWAISVHRAQGMTVEQGEVDVKNAFEFGQIYGKCVAMRPSLDRCANRCRFWYWYSRAESSSSSRGSQLALPHRSESNQSGHVRPRLLLAAPTRQTTIESCTCETSRCFVRKSPTSAATVGVDTVTLHVAAILGLRVTLLYKLSCNTSP